MRSEIAMKMLSLFKGGVEGKQKKNYTAASMFWREKNAHKAFLIAVCPAATCRQSGNFSFLAFDTPFKKEKCYTGIICMVAQILKNES